MSLEDVLQNKVLVLDGAMGTMIQRYNLQAADYELGGTDKPLKGNSEVLNLTRPYIIEEIHMAYLQAGADIIETNTFNANPISQEDYNLSHRAAEMAFEAVKLAKNAIEQFNSSDKKYIAGAVGPTNKTLSLSPDVNNPGFRALNFNTLVEAYAEQIAAMKAAGVDIILIETIFDTLNAKAAIMAAKQTAPELPIMISGTITDASGRTLSGQTVEAFAISVAHSNALSIGLNCALGADQLLPYVEALKKNTNSFVSVYPNAGLPNEMGAYDQSPEQFKELLRPYLDKKLVNIVGGCCGTTPQHIAAIASLIKEKSL